MTTPRSVCSTQETYVVLGELNVIDGILHLMAQNVQSQRQLKELFTFHRPKATPIVTAILKVIVTRFLKVTYVWGSGLASVRVQVSEMVILVGSRCLVLRLKKYHLLKLDVIQAKDY